MDNYTIPAPDLPQNMAQVTPWPAPAVDNSVDIDPWGDAETDLPSRDPADDADDAGDLADLTVDLDGGPLADAEDAAPEGDIAAAALAGARYNPHARPGRYDRETRRRIRRENLSGRGGGPDSVGRNSPGYSGPGVDPAHDPHRIGSLLGHFVEDQGWQRPLAEARVFADWAELVGSDIAAHATPQTLAAGELRIVAESTAWATQLRLLSSRVLARLVAELGPDVVTKLLITGPAAPSWRHGGRSVRGHRGPRDTYG